MASTILVTGATGTIGSEVVKALASKPGVTVRIGVRSAAKAEKLKAGNVVPVDFEFDKPETIAAAVKGVDRVFLLTPFTDDVHLTHGDRRAYASYAQTERHKEFETVQVDFDQPPPSED